jgi:hypothetical protein
MTNGWDSSSHLHFDDVRLLRADRRPCPVCGHPTGDCAEGLTPPARIVGSEFYDRKTAKEPGVLVPEDIFDEVNITPRTKTKVLVARAGTFISREKAEQYGLIASA